MLDAARGAATATATARRRRDDGETRRRDTTADLRRDGTCGARCGARCGAGLLRGAARPCGSVRPSPSRRLSRRVVFAVVVVVVVVVASHASTVVLYFLLGGSLAWWAGACCYGPSWSFAGPYGGGLRDWGGPDVGYTGRSRKVRRETPPARSRGGARSAKASGLPGSARQWIRKDRCGAEGSVDAYR